MSGRGRGRGRGRGSAPQSISQQFLLRSAQEAGFDVRNLRALNHSSSIFPDLEWHSSGERRLHDGELTSGDLASKVDGAASGVAVKQEGGASSHKAEDTGAQRTPQQIYLISKSREMHHRFQTSVFYVRSSKEVPDVVRYTDRFLPPANIDSGAVLSHCLGGRKRTRAGVFVPEELCGGQRRIIRRDGQEERNKKLKELNLEDLAKKIQSEGGDVVNEDEEKAEEGDEEAYYEEDGEESDGADYVQNYYESEGDESKGSDGEPTF
ncbi:hypothetical protein HJC23_002350 [Cyclotella cryptica]|uniref:DNA-directed RNA polymerase III subunit n=1 Tax=Cyclotella cryptica TaxID=29204 RepID=A0ABD3QKW4_9STRA|eukprot:CCRYP_004439-RA/>CCRYP_004439-RA protein AED:0.44 eAED:0.41 QI:0/-1/0/1/-1/1/1/0/264